MSHHYILQYIYQVTLKDKGIKGLQCENQLFYALTKLTILSVFPYTQAKRKGGFIVMLEKYCAQRSGTIHAENYAKRDV